MIEQVNDIDLLSFEIEKTAVDEKKAIGTFNKNTATIELLNPENKYSNLKSTYIKTIKGTFYVDDISPVQEEIKIKLNCYDLSQKFDAEYEPDNFKFPMTLKQWKKAICEYLGVECDDSDFPNSDVILTGLPYIPEKATYRYVMKMIAQAGCSWVIIDYDDVLKFQWFDNENVNEFDDWFELNTEDNETDEVNIVVLGRGDVEDNVVYPEIEPENPKEIRIDSNEILDLDRKRMIVPIYNQVNGFKYTVFSMKTPGNLNARVGQKIKYLDNNLKEHESFIMTNTLSFSGGDYNLDSNWISKFEAVELDETNTNYRFAESIEEKTNRTERLADKLNGQISDVVETVGQYDEKISAVEQTVDGINQKVENMINPVRTVSGTTYVKLPEAVEGPLLKLSISNMRYVYPSKKTFPSPTSFPKGNVLIIDKERNLTEDAKRFYMPYRNLYYYDDEHYDELVIERVQTENEDTEEITEKHTVSIIHRCKLNENLEVVPLTQSTTEMFDDIDVQLFKGDNYVYMESFQRDVVRYEATFSTESELKDVFATKIELETAITQTKSEIDLSVEQKIEDGTKAEDLIAKINMRPGEINLEGTVTANENFKILQDGSIVAKNGSFTGNIYLENGNKIIGGDGLLSNLQYINQGTIGGWDILGFSYYYDSDYEGEDGNFKFYYEDVMINALIPESFTVQEAYLTLLTTPIYNGYTNNSPTFTIEDREGKPKRLKLYKTDSIVTRIYHYIYGDANYVDDNYDPVLTEIKNAFKEEEYTPKNSGVGTVDSITSINLKDYIENGQLNNFLIRTSVPKVEHAKDTALSAENTGIAKMILNIFGYMRFEDINKEGSDS